MSIEEAKQKYLELCEKASEEKSHSDYYHHVGIVRGYIRAIADFFGATVASAIVDEAEKKSLTTLGIPHFNRTKTIRTCLSHS